MNNLLETNVENRERLIANLHEEVIGPLKNFKYANIIDEQTTKENITGNIFAYKYGGKTEEIFNAGRPSKKYASGLLYPRQTVPVVEDEIGESEEAIEGETQIVQKDVNQNPYIQSTMGITFAVPLEAEKLNVNFECGIYNQIENYNVNLQINEHAQNWWFRKSYYSHTEIDLQRNERLSKEYLEIKDGVGKEKDDTNIVLHSHIRELKKLKIVTLTIENAEHSTEEKDILFQCLLEASLADGESFVPYPKASDMNIEISEEEKKFEFLYLNEKNYAFGHDCATEWDINENDEVTKIKSTFLPEYEIKTMTPDIKVGDKLLEIHHAKIASCESHGELLEILTPLINGYENWFKKLKDQNVLKYYEGVKQANLKEIEHSIIRMKKGLALLKEDSVFKCFKLANLAMLMQMNNGKSLRSANYENGFLYFDKKFDVNGFDDLNYLDFERLNHSIKKQIDLGNPAFDKKWRGFQIGFILQSLDAMVNKKSEDRNIVDLIWFPTGGGKTEAYLGVAAFSMLYRRMIDKSDVGVDILMRYTLRLLTADQFQRAARLICSIDYIREKFKELLGEEHFSIGLWVGKSSMPNTIKEASKALLEYQKDSKNNFIVESCPWCGAEMKVINNNGNNHYLGYKVTGELEVYCPDEKCHFHNHLPISFVDEQLYKNPPTFLIGTIDKFVRLTWVPEARSLFGIDNDGYRKFSPPNIVIQDELHLISGPLGSLSGMYETLIENLCTDERHGIKPKIIAATATIKSYQNQIKALYGRQNTNLFPPAGFDINDNYFSSVEVDDDGKPVPGRKYVGLYSTTQGKLQSQVQTLSSLLISGKELESNYRDPFWTILSFYNTINDIGKAQTLTEADIKDTMNSYYKNRGIKDGRILKDKAVKELTSRLSNGEISQSLTEMKTNYTTIKNRALDVVLASNIIEVGVDVDRLALMTIIGQPKSTAQYIQVSGRVGRKPHESPGLIVTVYNRGDSNDKSHYEHFKEYHQKLYANVEEASVTPFSNFSIKRGLPAVIVGYIRQRLGLNSIGRYPDANAIKDNEDSIIQFVSDYVGDKMSLVDDSEFEILQETFEDIMNKLTTRDYEAWELTQYKNGVMVPMQQQEEIQNDDAIPMINSMRNVDSQSRLKAKGLENKYKGLITRKRN